VSSSIDETIHAAAFIVNESDDGYYSRDNVVVAISQTLVPGSVLGKTAVAANVTSSAAASAANTGNGVFTIDATAPVSTAAQDGVYEVVCIAVTGDGGEFAVFDPAGVEIGRVAVAGTFDNQIKFAIADGSTDFAAGDRFLVTVGVEYDGDMQYAALNLSGTDGTQNAVAVAVYPVTTDGTHTAHLTAITGHATVRLADLTWPAGITAAQKAHALDQLRSVGIKHL
jgi:hypothetical protein